MSLAKQAKQKPENRGPVKKGGITTYKVGLSEFVGSVTGGSA